MTMDLSNPVAVLLIVTGLIGFLVLLRTMNAASRDDAEPELKRARRQLNALTSSLRHRRRAREARVAPAEVREAIESIAGCTRILRRNATSAHAAALESIEQSAVLLSSVVDSLAQRPDSTPRRGRARM